MFTNLNSNPVELGSNLLTLHFRFTSLLLNFTQKYRYLKFHTCSHRGKYFFTICWFNHSMATTNLNKSEELVTNTTTVSKYIPKRPRICINWNSPFQTKNYLVKVSLNMNIMNKIYLIKNNIWKSYESRSERGDFNWCIFLAS